MRENSITAYYGLLLNDLGARVCYWPFREAQVAITSVSFGESWRSEFDFQRQEPEADT